MWFYAKNGEQHGPVEADDIRLRLKSGELSNETLVWREGLVQWSPLAEILELREPVPSFGGAAQGEERVGGADRDVAAGLDVAPVASPMASPKPLPLVAPVPQNTMALTSMILGIVSIVTCTFILTAIPAIVCGHIARKQFRESPMAQSGEGMATTGLILGYLITVLSVVGIVLYVVFVVAFVSNVSSGLPVPTPTPVALP